MISLLVETATSPLPPATAPPVIKGRALAPDIGRCDLSEHSNAPIGGEVEDFLRRYPCCVRFLAASQKLDMDLARKEALARGMDDDRIELIAQLCTRIGMLMEDHCELALTMRKRAPDAQEAAIAKLGLALTQMTALLNAAKALQDQMASS